MKHISTNLHATVIGAGLAGSECAWQLAESGVHVTLHEMRPIKKTDAHHTDGCAELVCSNSFRSDDAERNAVGLLHEEMRKCHSLIMHSADAHQVPAGGALAVDREAFSEAVTHALHTHPNITIRREEITQLPDAEHGACVIATGPLTSTTMSEAILAHTGAEYLAFFDAIAPIVLKDSVDMSKAWFQSRYDKTGPGGTGKDYLNCPMNESEYHAFVQALLDGEKTEFKEWEKNTPYFEGCLPIEVMAERGIETLRFGPMKPVGLTNPHIPPSIPPASGGDKRGGQPYAVVQLRQDNKIGTLYNIVGFQTKLKYAEQQRVFKMIPALENAEFVRLGGIHRNTFINSPVLLDNQMRMKTAPHLRFAGQMTGVEGYVESAATGLLVGRLLAAELLGNASYPPPPTTAMGALVHHITGGAMAKTFQPMNVNFGLFSPLEGKVKKDQRTSRMVARARQEFDAWLNSYHFAFNLPQNGKDDRPPRLMARNAIIDMMIAK